MIIYDNAWEKPSEVWNYHAATRGLHLSPRLDPGLPPREAAETLRIRVECRGEGLYNYLFQGRRVRWIEIKGEGHIIDLNSEVEQKGAFSVSIRNYDRTQLAAALKNRLDEINRGIDSYNISNQYNRGIPKDQRHMDRVVLVTTGRKLDKALQEAVDERFATQNGEFPLKLPRRRFFVFNSSKTFDIVCPINGLNKRKGISGLSVREVQLQIKNFTEAEGKAVTDRAARAAARRVVADIPLQEFLQKQRNAAKEQAENPPALPLRTKSVRLMEHAPAEEQGGNPRLYKPRRPDGPPPLRRKKGQQLVRWGRRVGVVPELPPVEQTRKSSQTRQSSVRIRTALSSVSYIDLNAGNQSLRAPSAFMQVISHKSGELVHPQFEDTQSRHIGVTGSTECPPVESKSKSSPTRQFVVPNRNAVSSTNYLDLLGGNQSPRAMPHLMQAIDHKSGDLVDPKFENTQPKHIGVTGSTEEVPGISKEENEDDDVLADPQTQIIQPPNSERYSDISGKFLA